jgi:hypothetical protein
MMLAALISVAASAATPGVGPPSSPLPVVTISRPIILVQSPTPSSAISQGMVRLYPEEAVMKAADAAPGFVTAVFDFTVRRAEQVGTDFFLNSEEDYRDPRNVSVVLDPEVQRQLRNSYGNDLSGYFLGHHLLALGAVRRVQIDFIDDRGKSSGKYYYQTHIRVASPRQLERTDAR